MAVWPRQRGFCGRVHSKRSTTPETGKSCTEPLPLARVASRGHYERALAIFEEVLGPEHPKVGTLVNNLGGVLQDMGDLEGAREHIERALAIDEAAYGHDHPEVGRDVNNLGLVLKAMGDLEGAREHYERALAICRRAYGEGHPRTQIVLRNLESLGEG